MVTTSSRTRRTTTADLMAFGTSINKFLKLMLHDDWSLAPVTAQELTPIQPFEMDTKADPMTASDHTMTNIMEETTANNVTAMDIALPTPAIDPSIYLAMKVVLPSPPMITTVALYSTYTQWAALTAALKAYKFPLPLPGMVFPEHDWCHYRQPLRDQITSSLIPGNIWTGPRALSCQDRPGPDRAWVPGRLLPSASTAQLDKHGQPIGKIAWYEHSIKKKMKQEEEVEYCKAHRDCMMDEPCARRTLPLSTSSTKHCKTPSECTT
uniref:Uncharacterized protein n=1 Tax=Romanomermis culicivorax TaxID=13658 RepID=A0A915JVJ4_ROMCU